MNQTRLFLMLIFILSHGQAQIPNIPKIGLVLSGGGARGAAHIGVLQFLETHHIPLDVIVGTSMGAVVGGLYASGLSIKELEALLSIDWQDAFNDDSKRASQSFRRKQANRQFLVQATPGFREGQIQLPSGAIQGQKLTLILKSVTLPVAHIDNFDHLEIPFRAIATDIVTGNSVTISHGDLALALRASMSVPTIFAPVNIAGQLLVDGGVSNNLPVDVARQLGADLLIVVDISTPLNKKEKLNNLLTIADQLSSILTRRNTEANLASLSTKDILIIPKLGNFSSSDFASATEIISLGYQAAQQQKEKLLPLSSLKTSPQFSLRKTTKPLINFIQINNNSSLSNGVLQARLNLKLGEPLDLQSLEDNIAVIYALDLFESVRYEIISKNNQSGIQIDVIAKSWGPNYLQFDFSLSGDFDGDNQFSLGTRYSKTAINKLGGQWHTSLQIGEAVNIATQFYQPLDRKSQYFISTTTQFHGYNVSLSENGNEISENRITAITLNFAMGKALLTWGELRLGNRLTKGKSEQRIGQINNIANNDFHNSDVFFRFSIDKMDHRNFPHKGVLGRFEWSIARTEIGADKDFDQLQFQWLNASTRGHNSLLLGAQLNYTSKGIAPLFAHFRLGGFNRLSGFRENSLSGQHSALFFTTVYHRLHTFKVVPLYLGATLEAGNVWQQHDEIQLDSLFIASSLFLGWDTFLGPLYIGYGYAESGHDSLFISLGRVTK